MVNIAGGSGVLQDVLGGAGAAANDLLRAAELTGWIRPSLIGAESSSFLPSLQREAQQAATGSAYANAANAARANDISAWTAQAQNRLGELNLLGSLRGPKDAIAYNYMLNRIAPPAGTQAQGSYLPPLAASGNPLSAFTAGATPGALAASAPKMLPNMGLPSVAPKPTPVQPPKPTQPAVNQSPEQLKINAATLPTGERPIAFDGNKAIYQGGITWDLTQGPPPATLTQGMPGVGTTPGTVSDPNFMGAQQPGEDPYNPVQGMPEDPGNYGAIAENANDLFQPDSSGQDFRFEVNDEGTLVAIPLREGTVMVRRGAPQGGPSLVGQGVRDPLALVGDEPGGKPELLVNHGDGSFDILNNDTTKRLLDSGMIEKMDMSEYKDGTKSRRQVRFLLSKGSPLSGGQKQKLKGELHSGAVKVRGYADGSPVFQSLSPGRFGNLGDSYLPASGAMAPPLVSAPAQQPINFGDTYSTNAVGAQSRNVGNPGDSYLAGDRAFTPATSPEQVLGNTTYSQQAIANLPAIQKLIGNMPSKGAWGTGLDMRVPGTSTQLPGMINTTTFMRQAPSERALIQSLYETPVEMGGLGIDWQDVVEMSKRTSPVGSGFQTMAGYGR